MKGLASGPGKATDVARRYPPLVVIVAALVLAVFALPSALNLPQANPGQTQEYAPVPGNGGAPPGGNLAAVGLGSSSTGPGGSVGGGSDNGAGLPGGGLTVTPPASNKSCVGTPPRQTEDPLSPPCVPSYSANNGGATYQGVTGSEIRVLMYIPGGYCSTGSTAANQDAGSQGVETRPAGNVYDLSSAMQSGEPYHVVAARMWQTYFNLRYQTYNRKAHFYVQYSTDECDPAKINADAAQDEQNIHPFAVVFPDVPNDGKMVDTFGKAMANYGVFSFGGSAPLAASFYSSYPGLIWSYLPSTDIHAEQFASWVCSKVVGQPVKITQVGAGGARKLGIMYPAAPHQAVGPTGNPYEAGDAAGNAFGIDAQKDIERCSGNSNIFGNDVATINDSGAITVGEADTQDATLRMNNFQRDGVTTVIWAGGYETNDTAAASSLGYEPEWIVAGDGGLDDLVGARYQDPGEWSHAWVMSDQPLDPAWQQTICYQAIKETDSAFPDSDTAIPCRMYADYRLLFTAIQVAGPTLNPAHVSQGLHAIPGVQTSDPQVPACFFASGDYTCIKDSIAMWWDQTQRSQFSQGPGCYRVPSAGKRYLPGGWPSGNVDMQKDANSDPCNGYLTGRFADPSGQGPGAPPGQ